MKKIILICCGCLLFTAVSCQKDSDTKHYRIRFYKASDDGLYIIRGSNYPDTTLLGVQNVMTPGWFCEVNPILKIMMNSSVGDRMRLI